MSNPNGRRVVEVPTTGGLVVFASSGPARTAIIPDQDPSIVDWQETVDPKRPWWKFWRSSSSSCSYGCGHTAPRYFTLRIWGREVSVRPEVSGESCPDCSLRDLQSQSFRCCLCSLAVIPGEPVAVYDASSIRPKDFEIKVVEGLALGCMNWNCCPSGGFYGGNWTGSRVRWWRENDE